MREIALVTAFWKRERVARAFVDHYNAVATDLEARGVVLIPCAAYSPEDDDSLAVETARNTGWSLVRVPNNPLCEKFNSAAALAFELPLLDGIFACGSDDFMDADYFMGVLAQHDATGAELIGAQDIYFYSPEADEAFRWKGYDGSRKGEPVGAGRFISRSLLARWVGRPWPRVGDRGLDGAMWNRADVVSAKVLCLPMRELGGRIVDVKDGAGLTSWRSVRDKLDNEEIDRQEIADLLPPSSCFPPLTEVHEGPWFAPDGEIVLLMIARVRDAAELDAFTRAILSASEVADAAYVLFDKTSSVEATQVASEVGCLWGVRRWRDDFSVARNLAIDEARLRIPSMRWALVLDADETLFGDTLRPAVAAADADGCDSITIEVRIRTDEGLASQPRSVRLHRVVQGVRWERAVHNELRGLSKHLHDTQSYIETSYEGTMVERANRQIPKLLEMVKEDPLDARSHRYLARAYMALRENNLVKFHCQAAIRIDERNPMNVPAFLMLAAVHNGEGDRGGAWSILNKALINHSLYPEVWRHMTAMCLMAWTGAVHTRSAYDGVSQVRVPDFDARCAAAAELLALPVSLVKNEEAGS